MIKPHLSSTEVNFGWCLTMGCCNSPETFSRLMVMVISDLKCCLAFIDDTTVFSSSFEHLTDLQSPFDRFRSANLKLKRKKCRLFKTECEFLGNWVSSEGIGVQKTKITCI